MDRELRSSGRKITSHVPLPVKNLNSKVIRTFLVSPFGELSDPKNLFEEQLRRCVKPKEKWGLPLFFGNGMQSVLGELVLEGNNRDCPYLFEEQLGELVELGGDGLYPADHFFHFHYPDLFPLKGNHFPEFSLMHQVHSGDAKPRGVIAVP